MRKSSILLSIWHFTCARARLEGTPHRQSQRAHWCSSKMCVQLCVAVAREMAWQDRVRTGLSFHGGTGLHCPPRVMRGKTCVAVHRVGVGAGALLQPRAVQGRRSGRGGPQGEGRRVQSSDVSDALQEGLHCDICTRSQWQFCQGNAFHQSERRRQGGGRRRCVGSENSQTTPTTTNTASICQLLGAADAQTAHPATSSAAPAHQLLGSANAEMTPAGAPAAAADRKKRPDATCEGKNG